jgi:hypothetical protein
MLHSYPPVFNRSKRVVGIGDGACHYALVLLDLPAVERWVATAGPIGDVSSKRSILRFRSKRRGYSVAILVKWVVALQCVAYRRASSP